MRKLVMIWLIKIENKLNEKKKQIKPSQTEPFPKFPYSNHQSLLFVVYSTKRNKKLKFEEQIFSFK